MNKKNIFNMDQEIEDLDSTEKQNKGMSQEGLREGFTRVTFILKNEQLEEIKNLSTSKQRTILEIMNEVLESYLSTKKNIKIPIKKKIK